MDSKAPVKVRELIGNIEKVILGKRQVVKLCIAGLLARGHLLIEDIPGIGKTTLAQGLARSIDCSFSRIQFTSDMLPSDILGVSVLNPKTNDFEFHPGPIFASIILADEINRTPPKSQSALLEAMSESRITLDGKSHVLPKPFMVLATQNPIEYEGTYTLPESQLDRFMLRVEMGYPPLEDELHIMQRRDPHEALSQLKPVLHASEVLDLQEAGGKIMVEDSVLRYMLSIVHATRDDERVQLGVSPRGAVALYEVSQAHALVEGRDYVTPGDVKAMAVPVLAHRLIVRARGGTPASNTKEQIRVIEDIMRRVPVPV